MRTSLAALALGVGLAVIAASPAAAEDLSPDALLARYQPVAVLSQGELFDPTSVDDFLVDATLTLRAADGSFQPAEMPEPGLPVHGDGWRLDRCSGLSPGPRPTLRGCDTPLTGR